MTANRSLDEFAGRSGDGGAADAEAGEGSPVEPVVSTYAWSPDGGPCASCGESAAERWRDGDRLVCTECKAW